MARWRYIALTIGVFGLAAVVAGLLTIYSGLYDVAATRQHGKVTNWLLHTAAFHSIDRRAADVVVPDLRSRIRVDRGLRLFRQNCAQCHGAPGEPPAAFAMGLTPGAPRLMQVAREWSPKDIYWTVTNGVKMTGMPAWRYRMNDRELWDVVAFVETLPSLSPTDYKREIDEMSGQADAPNGSGDLNMPPTFGDLQRGKVALEQYACVSCHVIPGVIAPPGHVGPTLDGVGGRAIIAGLLANTQSNMVAWLRHPQDVKPGTAMPDMGITAQHALDMTAYLEALK